MNAPKERPRIYTLGHGDRPLPEFVGCLASFGVTMAVDVRSYPVSRSHPQYDRERLEAAVAAAGLAYRWLGPELGGFRTDGYVTYTRTAGFREGIEKLATLARESAIAVFCAERDPARCHRRYITRALRSEFTVCHIEAPGQLFPPEGAPGQGTLFPLD